MTSTVSNLIFPEYGKKIDVFISRSTQFGLSMVNTSQESIEHLYDNRIRYYIFTILILIPFVVFYFVPEFTAGMVLAISLILLGIVLTKGDTGIGQRRTGLAVLLLTEVVYSIYVMVVNQVDFLLILITFMFGGAFSMIFVTLWGKSPYLLNLEVLREKDTVLLTATETFPYARSQHQMQVTPADTLRYKGNTQATSFFSSQIFTGYLYNETTNDKIPVGLWGNAGFSNIARFVHLLDGFDLKLQTIPDSPIDKFVPKLDKEVELSVFRPEKEKLPPKYYPVTVLKQITGDANYKPMPPAWSAKFWILVGSLGLVVVLIAGGLIPMYVSTLSNLGEFIGEATSRIESYLRIAFIGTPLTIVALTYIFLKVLALRGAQLIIVDDNIVEVAYSIGPVKTRYVLPIYLGLVVELTATKEVKLVLIDGWRPYYSLRVGRLENTELLNDIKRQYNK